MKQGKRLLALFLALLTVLTMMFTFAGCNTQKDEDPDSEPQTEDTKKKEDENEEDDKVIYRFSPDNEPTDYVRINTKGYGSMIIALYPEVAPKTVDHFKKLVKEDFYKHLTFHRVVEGMLVQTGDPKGDGTGGADTSVVGEFSANGFDNTLLHKRGVVSMARYDDDYDSASSQFFFCLKDIPEYDGEYAAFGEVIEGIETLDKLAAVQVFGEYPLNPPEILSVRFVYPD